MSAEDMVPSLYTVVMRIGLHRINLAKQMIRDMLENPVTYRAELTG